MTTTFYIAAAVALLATLMVITRKHAVHALLYLVVSLLAVAMMFFVLGAPLAAALEVIIYAGAIMVLFVFVTMLLNVGSAIQQESQWLRPATYVGPAILAAALLAMLAYCLFAPGAAGVKGPHAMTVIEPKQVGLSLFTTYLLGVELASLLLLAALVGVLHLGRPDAPEREWRP
jgi:NADH-quinone oxidoreductase subunit J